MHFIKDKLRTTATLTLNPVARLLLLKAHLNTFHQTLLLFSIFKIFLEFQTRDYDLHMKRFCIDQ